MKLCAIICEYNPFHNGHQYQIEESLKQTGCDGILCVMNTNYSQRGEPTIVDKKVRALMAIVGGASAVVAIPTYFSVTNAETFAMAAVKIASSFKDVTHISFGSECGDITSITELATFLYKEPDFYKKAIKVHLQEGYSLGTSKIKALAECISKKLVSFTNPKLVVELLKHPNNILGVEYVRALLKLKNKKITPITIKRQEAYDGYELDIDYKLSSASSIRESIIKSKHIWNIRKYIPQKSFFYFTNYLKDNEIPDFSLWGKFALYKLRTTSTSELALNYDVVEGFENKLVLSARECVNYEQFLSRATSKRYSTNRVKRIVTACLLNLRSDVTKQIFKEEIPYIKVIACRNDRNLIASLHNNSSVVVTRKSLALLALKSNFSRILASCENRANSLYEMLINTPEDKQLKRGDVSDIFEKTIFVDKDDFLGNKTIIE